jgi:hypothetical protein
MDRPRFPDLCFNKKVANFCLALYLAFVTSCYSQLLLEGAALLQKLYQACWDACYVCQYNQKLPQKTQSHLRGAAAPPA